MNLKDIDRKLGDMMKEEKIVNKHLDIPFKEFMPGQIIQSSQFNDDMLDIEDKVNEIVDKHNLNVNKLHEHLDDKENPHEVNPHQIGTYEGSEIDAFINDVKNGNLNDEAITNRVLADACVDNRVLVDGVVTLSKLDTNVGNQIDISNNMSIKERYTKLETDAIIQEKVGDGTYSKEQIDAKFEEYQAGTIVDGTIDVTKLKGDVGRKLDIEHNPSISNRYTKSEVNTLIAKNGLPKDWGNLSDEVDDEIVTQSGLGSLPISDVMVCGEFKATETDVLNVKIQDVEFAKGEFDTLEERLDSVDTQLAHNTNRLEKEGVNVLYPPTSFKEFENDTDRFKQLLEYCRINKLKLIVPNGEYNFNDTIKVSNTEIIHVGRVIYKFNLTSEKDGFVLEGGNTTKNHLVLNGGCIIDMQNTGRDGVVLTKGEYPTINDITIQNTVRDGFRIEPYSDYAWVENLETNNLKVVNIGRHGLSVIINNYVDVFVNKVIMYNFEARNINNYAVFIDMKGDAHHKKVAEWTWVNPEFDAKGSVEDSIFRIQNNGYGYCNGWSMISPTFEDTSGTTHSNCFSILNEGIISINVINATRYGYPNISNIDIKNCVWHDSSRFFSGDIGWNNVITSLRSNYIRIKEDGLIEGLGSNNFAGDTSITKLVRLYTHYNGGSYFGAGAKKYPTTIIGESGTFEKWDIVAYDQQCNAANYTECTLLTNSNGELKTVIYKKEGVVKILIEDNKLTIYNSASYGVTLNIIYTKHR